MIDPGYDGFDLWVTEPDGVRRRYRSPALYCCNPGTIMASHAQPFERDIPIFGQSGGYTFRKAGVHRLAATLRLPGGRMVYSNELEVFVKQARPDSAQYRRLRDAMTHRATAQLLFYKSARTPRRAAEQAIARTTGIDHRFVRAATRYAAGMTLLKSRGAGAPPPRDATRQLSMSALKSALDSGQLNAHRERKASACIDQWDRPRRTGGRKRPKR
jgi:hypothetical protein